MLPRWGAYPMSLIRIERNEFISGLRRLRPTVSIDGAVIADSLSHPPRQESGIVMRAFKKAFQALKGHQRQALLMTATASLRTS